MKKIILSTGFIALAVAGSSQTNPAILAWLQNTSIYGSHYVQNNFTPIQDNVLANCQTVQYSANWVYVTTNGIPAYTTGPFLDGNPSLATDQNAIFKFPLNPTQNTGNPTATTMGNIGVFINGVALFDYRDGVSWNNAQQQERGGPLGGSGDGVWNRDAVVAEMIGFDCAKGHPAMGNYHHHQNPSAFDLDLVQVSTICNLYDSDGLYIIDSAVHSPLLGFAYDGFPIYGAYGYANANGTGGIVRIKSGYQLRNITARTHYADGSDVTDGPAINSTYPLGRYREDYEWISHAGDDSYLDEHNGRFCVTPEYPNGIYCYFCTVDENWNSAYPYAVGPTFYGNKVALKVTQITEATTTYIPPASGISQTEMDAMQFTVYPNPAQDFVAVQVGDMVLSDIKVTMYDMTGRVVQETMIYPGSTIAYFDTRTVYDGQYIIQIQSGESVRTTKVVLHR
jgi:hypothetical protein